MVREEADGGAVKRRRRAQEPAGGSAAGPGARTSGRAVARDRNFYAALLSETELAEVQAAGDHGLDDEVALLRVLARRAVASGDHREALAVVRALVATLKAQHGLTGGDARRLDRAMAAVLEELEANAERPR